MPGAAGLSSLIAALPAAADSDLYAPRAASFPSTIGGAIGVFSAAAESWDFFAQAVASKLTPRTTDDSVLRMRPPEPVSTHRPLARSARSRENLSCLDDNFAPKDPRLSIVVCSRR